MNVYNPSYLQFKSSILPVKVFFENQQIGNTSITPFQIQGNTQNAILAPTSIIANAQVMPAIEDFLNNYMQSLPSSVIVQVSKVICFLSSDFKKQNRVILIIVQLNIWKKLWVTIEPMQQFMDSQRV